MVARSFADGTRRAFEAAWESTDEHFEVRLDLAGWPVLLRIAGDALATRIVPAIAHLADERPAAQRGRGDPSGGAPGSPGLRIGCWDREHTAVDPPPPPASIDDFLPRGRIRGLTGHRLRVAYDPGPRMLSVYDEEHEAAFVAVGDAATLPSWVERAPLRTVLTAWASRRGLAFLHASGVANHLGAVALAGASGCGKSTTAWNAVASGWRFLADDACIATLDGAPTLHSVYGLAKLEDDALDRFPGLASLPTARHDGQMVVDARPYLTGHAPLRAVVLPEVGDASISRLSPCSPADALRALVRGSIHEGDGAGSAALPALTRLVRSVPCHHLVLGSDPDGVVRALADALEERAS